MAEPRERGSQAPTASPGMGETWHGGNFPNAGPGASIDTYRHDAPTLPSLNTPLPAAPRAADGAYRWDEAAPAQPAPGVGGVVRRDNAFVAWVDNAYHSIGNVGCAVLAVAGLGLCCLGAEAGAVGGGVVKNLLYPEGEKTTLVTPTATPTTAEATGTPSGKCTGQDLGGQTSPDGGNATFQVSNPNGGPMMLDVTEHHSGQAKEFEVNVVVLPAGETATVNAWGVHEFGYTAACTTDEVAAQEATHVQQLNATFSNTDAHTASLQQLENDGIISVDPSAQVRPAQDLSQYEPDAKAIANAVIYAGLTTFFRRG